MTQVEFEKIQNDLLCICVETLNAKALEYAEEGGDRLHNFKQAAHLKGETPLKALFGMWAKHLISISDMCMSDASYSMDIWEEKLKDNINYSILAMAMTKELSLGIFDGEKPCKEDSWISRNMHHGFFKNYEDLREYTDLHRKDISKGDTCLMQNANYRWEKKVGAIMRGPNSVGWFPYMKLSDADPQSSTLNEIEVTTKA